jgi:hypothetical protein
MRSQRRASVVHAPPADRRSGWPRSEVPVTAFKNNLAEDVKDLSKYAKAEAYPDHTDQTYPRGPWFARRDAAAYGIALDARGKIAWGRSDIGGDPIVVCPIRPSVARRCGAG